MKKILFLLCLSVITLYATIDERKIDLYYANGIMMLEDEDIARKIWKQKADDLLATDPKIKKYISDIDIAYNISNGFANDMFEAFLQKTALEPAYGLGWIAFKELISKIRLVGNAIGMLATMKERTALIIHDGTLNTQIAKYKQSIKDGHGVVIVAHSQGNLFTQEAFNSLKDKDAWMREYFHTIGVATPGNEIVNNGNGVTFHNDFITNVPGSMISNIINNPNKYDYRDIKRNPLGNIIGDTLFRDAKSIKYHGFDYYLGSGVYESELDPSLSGVVNVGKKKTNRAKKLIFSWLYTEIIAHTTRDSQYKPKNPVLQQQLKRTV